MSTENLQTSTKISPNRTVLDLHTVTPHGEFPLPDQMGSRYMNIRESAEVGGRGRSPVNEDKTDELPAQLSFEGYICTQ